MKRAKQTSHVVAPYTKYNKAPYKYRFYGCKHTNRVRQAATAYTRDGLRMHWAGTACAQCGTIIETFDR